MKTFVQCHFLSQKDEGRFFFFVVFAFLLLVAGVFNKERGMHVLPSQYQIIDSSPEQSALPSHHRPVLEKSNFRKV